MKTKIQRLLAVLAWLAVILVLSAIPKRYDFIPVWFWKAIYPWPPFSIFFSWEELVSALAHLSMFAVLAYLAVWALTGNKKPPPAVMAGIFAACLLAAVADELFQEYFPQRGFQIEDIFMDAAGALLGLFFFWKKRNRDQARESQ